MVEVSLSSQQSRQQIALGRRRAENQPNAHVMSGLLDDLDQIASS